MLKVNDLGLAPVTFTKDVDIYLPGMTAGFPLETAQRLVNEGKAKPWVEPEKTEEPVVATIDERRLVSSLNAGQVEGSVGFRSTQYVRSNEISNAVKTQEAEAKLRAQEEAADEARAKREAAAAEENGEGEDGKKVMGADDEVVIPENWKSGHHATRRSLARQITGEEPADLAAADATIEQALAARAARDAGNGDGEQGGDGEE